MMKYQDFSETGEKTVAYIALYGDNKLQARPQDMFLDEVNKNGQKYKFELQEIKVPKTKKDTKVLLLCIYFIYI